VTLAWLVVAAALTVAAVPDRPRLYAIAVLAGALSIGTKTTAGPLVVIVLAVGAARLRAWSRPALLLAGLAGILAGGTWYVRNLIQHGSPFWPLLPGPFGDPVPASLVPADVRFISRPLATLHGRLDDYARLMAGNVLLLAGGLGAAGLARTRRVAAASVLTALSLLLWADAPFTGLGRDPAGDLSLAVTRYLLPGVACGAVALALAARRRGAGGRLAAGALVAALLWSLYQSAQFDFPTLPSLARLVAGAAVGAAAGAGAARALRRAPLRLALPLAAAVLLAGGLAVAAPGYVARNAATNTTFAAPLLRWFSAQAAFRDGADPIATTAPRIGLLAGAELRHGLDLIGPRESCAAIRARARRGWVVVLDFPTFLIKFFPTSPAGACLAGAPPRFVDGGFRVYRSG
ncbi:MAG TPA: hypothetical protein VFR49_11005, partial [Solirubrobacteraceae bacterium]|nr:hypothetical protein [Solirubrobacteraceae bacterium]